YYRKGRDVKSLLNLRGNENTLCYPIVCFNPPREAMEGETGGEYNALVAVNIRFFQGNLLDLYRCKVIHITQYPALSLIVVSRRLCRRPSSWIREYRSDHCRFALA